MTQETPAAKSLTRLFLNSFSLSLFSFGGGSTIIALMQKRYVEELGWIRREEMLDLLTLAQTAPGATAVNVSILLGHHVLGIKGALVSALATSLPPLLVLMCITGVYQAIRDSAPLANALRGMRACAAAMVAAVALSLAAQTLRKRDWLLSALLLAVTAAAVFLRPDTYLLILGGLLLGVLRAAILTRRDR